MTLAMTPAATAPSIECPESYVGVAPVGISGVHVGSPGVSGLPSVAPNLIADSGRHRLYTANLLYQLAMYPSAMPMSISANRRACSQRSRCFWRDSVIAIRFHIAGELSNQNSAIWVCSG